MGDKRKFLQNTSLFSVAYWLSSCWSKRRPVQHKVVFQRERERERERERMILTRSQLSKYRSVFPGWASILPSFEFYHPYFDLLNKYPSLSYRSHPRCIYFAYTCVGNPLPAHTCRQKGEQAHRKKYTGWAHSHVD